LKEIFYSEFCTPSFFGYFASVKVPGVVHHDLEVSIIINAHGYVVVIFIPFLQGDDTISGIGVTVHITPMIFKGIKELCQDFIFSFLS